MTGLDTVALDIETTGFAVDDRLTVVRFDADVGSQVFLNTGGRSCPADLEAQVDEDLIQIIVVNYRSSPTTSPAMTGNSLQ